MTSHKNRWCFGWIFDRRECAAKTIPYRNQGSLIETTNEALQATHTHADLISNITDDLRPGLVPSEEIDKYYWE